MKISPCFCYFVLLNFILISCGDAKKKGATTENIETSNPVNDTSKFDFSDFRIVKGRIGNIIIGMSLKEAETHLARLEKSEIESYDVGFDGGGAVYLYSFNKEPVLAIVPGYEKDSITAFVALHQELRTSNGLHPKMSVAELLNKYPKILFYQGTIFGGEWAEDTVNKWDFRFNTDSLTQIGSYLDIEDRSEAKRTDVKMDWITVR